MRLLRPLRSQSDPAPDLSVPDRPVGMRRHGRKYAPAVAALALAAGISACGSSGSSGGSSSAASHVSVTWGYFQGQVVSPGAVIGTQPTLEQQIPAKIAFTPINSGVAALAAMHAGSFQVVEGAGNPPVLGAMTSGTDFKVVYAEGYDGAGLYVNSKVIGSPSALAGHRIGDLVGSSEDFELKGYLTSQKLLSKVSVVPFSSDSAAVAAFDAGKLNAVYADVGAAAAGGIDGKPGVKVLTTAADIAKLGYPSLNVLVVADSLVSQNPSLVQKIVCTVGKAANLMTGSKRNTYFSTAAKLLGEPPSAVVQGSDQWPAPLTVQQQLDWFGSGTTSIAQSKIVQQVYKLSAQFLLQSGVVKSVPTTQEIASRVDPTFVRAAAKGACGGS